MNTRRTVPVALALLALAGIAAAAARGVERKAPPRLASAPAAALTESERQAVVAWASGQP